MKGILVSLTIIGVVLAVMCYTYKKVNHRNMIKDLWHDLFSK